MVPQMMTRLLIPTDMLNCSPAWGYTYFKSHIFSFSSCVANAVYWKSGSSENIQDFERVGSSSSMEHQAVRPVRPC